MLLCLDELKAAFGQIFGIPQQQRICDYDPVVWTEYNCFVLFKHSEESESVKTG